MSEMEQRVQEEQANAPLQPTEAAWMDTDASVDKQMSQHLTQRIAFHCDSHMKADLNPELIIPLTNQLGKD